jgi:hypothetical protein
MLLLLSHVAAMDTMDTFMIPQKLFLSLLLWILS